MEEKEKHSEKATVYLTKSVYQASKDMAHLDRLSWPQYIENLILRDLEARKDKLAKFIELSRE